MTLKIAVVDTNVVVAGLLTANPESPPARVLDGMLGGAFPYLLSPALLAEYRTVLLRPAILARHGLTVDEIDLLLEDLTAGAVWREPDGGVSAPDSGDDHLWSLTVCFPGSCLVTGDQLLLKNPPPTGRIMTPRGFIDSLT